MSGDESNSYISSGTSSYESDGEKKKEENKEDKILLEMMQDEFEEPSVNSYSRFKTQNEIDPD